MQYKFKNGSVVEGTIEQILNVAKILGEVVDLSQIPRPAGYYFSESKGTLMKIADMDAMHIRNALCKVTRQYYEDLAKERTLSNREFTIKFTSLTDIKLVQELFAELARK